MPAARQRPQQTLSTSLASHVRRQNVNNVLPLNYYYRSGHILLRQVPGATVPVSDISIELP